MGCLRLQRHHSVRYVWLRIQLTDEAGFRNSEVCHIRPEFHTMWVAKQSVLSWYPYLIESVRVCRWVMGLVRMKCSPVQAVTSVFLLLMLIIIPLNRACFLKRHFKSFHEFCPRQTFWPLAVWLISHARTRNWCQNQWLFCVTVSIEDQDHSEIIWARESSAHLSQTSTFQTLTRSLGPICVCVNNKSPSHCSVAENWFWDGKRRRTQRAH